MFRIMGLKLWLRPNKIDEEVKGPIKNSRPAIVNRAILMDSWTPFQFNKTS